MSDAFLDISKEKKSSIIIMSFNFRVNIHLILSYEILKNNRYCNKTVT